MFGRGRNYMVKEIINNIKSKIGIWSLYYRTEIVWFIIGFIIGALIL